MSNLEAAPAEVACGASQHLSASPTVEVLHPREVPLGGPRAIRVQRTLPQRQRSLIGAWCFVDHYGPRVVVAAGGDLDTAVLEQHCRASLAGYKIPRRWVQVESLPRNAYGKVVKRDLRAQLETAV